jgi:imidazolonepropionase
MAQQLSGMPGAAKMMKSGQSSHALLLINIRQLLTLRSSTRNPAPFRRAELKELGIIEDGAVLCVAGTIIAAGTTKEAQRSPWLKTRRKKILELDCTNKVVLPGFVDSHTHPVFMEPRLMDFESRVAGATYEEIAAQGGGIRSSIAAVRDAPEKKLAGKVVSTLEAMARHGTTTVEAKSGYGLSLESELKSLTAIRNAARQWQGTVVPTLLAAHAVPEEFRGRSKAYVELICREIIPLVAKRKLASFVDVFCERGAFSTQEAAKIFAAAGKYSLGTRAHVGQITETDLASLLCLRPASFDHLDHVSDRDIQRLAETGTIATLLPGANYFLSVKYPPARKLIDAGVAVALATDFNPGSSPTLSMPMILSLACTQMQMSPVEAIAAATINGAHALRLQSSKGSIEPGKDADLAVFDVKDYREIPYWFGENKCEATILNSIALPKAN